MKMLKGWIPTGILMMILMFGTTFANAGIVVAGVAGGSDPCTDTKDNIGIVVAGLTGIVVAGFTGIVVAGAADVPVDCGIVVAG
ncbi:MAG TPA: hypothetical protein VK468_08825 [Pyrinomonadaceae bacterium]|nr:hypothetical protein [Pyrinomonadaceae bacterium]